MALPAKYKQLLVDLLPSGRLWDYLNQPTLSKLLDSLAPEFARVDTRVNDLLREADPRTTVELLPEWERLLGLPDECTPDNATFDQRRAQVVQKYTQVGGISGPYYSFLIAQLGFPNNKVFKWFPFLAGRARAGDPLTNDFDVPFKAGASHAGDQLRKVGWLFYFNVQVPIASNTWFYAGQARAGDPLRAFNNELVKRTIKKLKPAHAGVTFTFTES